MSLTMKQKRFVQEIINNPKQSATEAASKTYQVSSRQTAGQIAHENMKKPEVVAELAKYSNTAESVIVEVMNRSQQMMNTDTARAVDWATNARQTADSLLDRVHGKATQQVQVQSQHVVLTLDLTAEKE